MSNEENNQNKSNKPKVEFFKQNNNKTEIKSHEEVKKKIDFFQKIILIYMKKKLNLQQLIKIQIFFQI